MAIENTFSGTLNAFQVMESDELEDRIDALMHQYHDLREDGYNRESLRTLDTLDLATSELRYRSNLDTPECYVAVFTAQGVAYKTQFHCWTKLAVIESYAKSMINAYTNITASHAFLPIIKADVCFFNRIVAIYEDVNNE